MSGTFGLALAYLAHHRGKSAVIVLCLAAILAVPMAVASLMGAAERALSARAEATPLLVGARGSRLDLAMAALHFTPERPEPVTMAAVDRIWDSGLATAIPLHLGFEAEGAPILGTTLDYFEFRGLEIAEGRGLAVLGEAVLGAAVAARLGLGPGDRLVSAPATLFDLAGAYPLAMKVVGVLAPTGSPDDRAVLVDIKTAWVIAGIGHGHEDVAAGAEGPVQADPALVAYREIAPETLESFHFHGDPQTYPVTAIIAVPHDARAGTLLRGRYLEAERAEQMVVPAAVIGGLLAELLRIKGAIDAVVAIVAAAALTALGLVLYLSVELRREEMATAAKLGASRWLVARLVGAEALLLLLAAAALAALVTAGVAALAPEAAARLLADVRA